jgi:2-C-methyl-D-erythritol 4-phosphate cytidylyltransferase
MSGVDKLLLDLQGRPLIVQTLHPFVNFNTGWIVVTANPERVEEFQTLFEESFQERASRIRVCSGGNQRQDSIFHGLRLLSQELPTGPQDAVMIHDGARPFVTEEIFEKLLRGLDGYDGVIPALPVRDTIKRVSGAEVIATEDRDCLRMVQTPQVFRLKTIFELHQRAQTDEFLGTDDASLLERYGASVGWVEGPAYNLKVTVPDDVALLNHLMELTGR